MPDREGAAVSRATEAMELSMAVGMRGATTEEGGVAHHQDTFIHHLMLMEVAQCTIYCRMVGMHVHVHLHMFYNTYTACTCTRVYDTDMFCVLKMHLICKCTVLPKQNKDLHVYLYVHVCC